MQRNSWVTRWETKGAQGIKGTGRTFTGKGETPGAIRDQTTRNGHHPFGAPRRRKSTEPAPQREQLLEKGLSGKQDVRRPPWSGSPAG